MLRGEEGREQARLQLKTYPMSTGSNGNLGSVMVFTHQWDEAIEQLNTQSIWIRTTGDKSPMRSSMAP
jgi:hypothetical protein